MNKDKFVNMDNIEITDLEIKKFLEDNDNGKVPKEISMGIDAVLNEICKENKNKPSKKINRILNKVAMVTAIIISLTIVTSIVNPQLVRAMPVVGRIFDFFTRETVNTLKNNSLLIGMTAKDKGISVTLEEIGMDSEKFMATLKVNGKNLNGNMVDVEVRGHVNDSNFSVSNSTTKRIDDNTLVVLFEGYLSELTINEKINIELYIGGILIDGKELNGTWKFSANVDKNEILIPSKAITPTEEVAIDDFIINVEKVTTSTLATTVHIKNRFNNYDFKNKSETDITNDSSKLSTIGYIFKDSLGKVLLSKDIEIKTDLNTMELSMKSELLGDLSYSDYIDVIPVLMGKSEMSYYDVDGNWLYECIGDSSSDSFEKIIIDKEYYNMPNNNQFFTIEELKGKTIESNNTGRVMIKDLEATDTYTKVTFKINDYYDLRFLGFMDIIDEDLNTYRNEGFSMGPIVENSKDKEVSVTLPPLDKSKKYTIALPRMLDLNIDDSNKIRVNLN